MSSSVRYAGPDPTADDDPSDQPLLGELTLGAPSHIYVGVWPGYLAGGSDSWMGFYPGMLDELRIYNKALSEDEIKALYNAEIEVMD